MPKTTKKSTAKGKARSQSAASAKYALAQQIRISQSEDTKAQLQKLLAAKKKIEVDASKVQKIDTSGLQLLTAFVIKAQEQEIEVEWQSPSEPLLDAAKLLNLTEHLGLVKKKNTMTVSIRDEVPNDMPIEPKIFPGHFRVQWAETIHMLDLSTNHIDSTVQESNTSMELLMETFSSLTEQLESLEEVLQNHHATESTKSSKANGSNGANGHDNNALLDHCADTKETINKIIIGLQFYDRMTQHLHNVRESLAVLAELIDDPERQNIPEEWVTLHNSIKTKYSKEQQKTIFNALMQGADMDEVFELFD